MIEGMNRHERYLPFAVNRNGLFAMTAAPAGESDPRVNQSLKCLYDELLNRHLDTAGK